MKKQPELTAMTRKSLVDAYFAAAAKGKRPTVAAVAELAGYNRCTFYRYFTDTEQLLTETESEICNAFRSSLSENAQDFSPTEVINSFASVYERYGEYLSVLLGRYGDARFTAGMKEMMYPTASRLFSPNCESDEAAVLKTEFILSGVLAAVTKWYDMGKPIPITRLGIMIKDTITICE